MGKTFFFFFNVNVRPRKHRDRERESVSYEVLGKRMLGFLFRLLCVFEKGMRLRLETENDYIKTNKHKKVAANKSFMPANEGFAVFCI